MPAESEKYSAFFSEKRQDIAFMNNVLSFQSFMSEHNVDMRKSIIRGDELFFNISCHAGSMMLDLRNENLDGKKINIKVDCLFGQIKVFVPAGGKIVNNASMILGDFSLRNKKKSWLNKLIGREEAPTQEANFTLVIHGNCAFAEFVVVY
jgi:predicted membrane protein